MAAAAASAGVAAATGSEGGTSWAVDYPRGDRYFARILKRLTTIDVRSVEQPVNPDDGDDIFDWPYLIVGLPGFWDLTDAQVKKIREYLDRGGFLLCRQLLRRATSGRASRRASTACSRIATSVN